MNVDAYEEQLRREELANQNPQEARQVRFLENVTSRARDMAMVLPGAAAFVALVAHLAGNPTEARATEAEVRDALRGSPDTTTIIQNAPTSIQTEQGGVITGGGLDGERVKVTLPKNGKLRGRDYPEQVPGGGEPPLLDDEVRVTQIQATITGNPNFRSEPTTAGNNIISSLSDGTQIDIFGYVDRLDGRWYHVKTTNRTGWVFYQFISVDVNSLHVISGPDLSAQASPPPPQAPTSVPPDGEGGSTVGATETPPVEHPTLEPVPVIPGYEMLVTPPFSEEYMFIRHVQDNYPLLVTPASAEVLAQTGLIAENSAKVEMRVVLKGCVEYVPGQGITMPHYPDKQLYCFAELQGPNGQNVLVIMRFHTGGDGDWKISTPNGRSTRLQLQPFLEYMKQLPSETLVDVTFPRYTSGDPQGDTWLNYSWNTILDGLNAADGTLIVPQSYGPTSPNPERFGPYTTTGILPPEAFVVPDANFPAT